MSQDRHSVMSSSSTAIMLWAALVWIMVIVSALAVVSTTQVVRRDVNELETLRREASHQQVRWGQYLLEQSTWAAYGRVENAATSELNMVAPTPEDIVLVRTPTRGPR
jgi:cell division protein FtsL